MKTFKDPFEEYLLTFQATEPPPNLLGRAVARARKRSRARVWAVAAAAILVVASGIVTFDRPRQPLPPIPPASTSIDTGALHMVLSRGGVDALFRQLDLASSQFAKGPNNLSED